METCLESNCEKKVVARGVCPMHYERAKRAGTLDQYKKRPNRADSPCRLAGCDKPGYALGYCQRHYDAYNRYGDPVSPAERKRLAGPAMCSTEGCDRTARAKGMCNRHYENARKHGDAIPERDLPLGDRLARIGWTVTPRGCWEWNGKRNDGGYGIFNAVRLGFDGSRAHRVMFELHVGPIPDGEEIRHTCDNPPCVNPAHLVPGTHRMNMDDMTTRGRSPLAYENRNNRCKNGHDMTVAGAYKIVHARGRRPYRSCITCARTRSREYARRKRAERSGAPTT